MKRTNRVLSLILALVLAMALGAGARAENTSYYLTLSDPYFTDGTAVYDLTGLTATLQITQYENVEQLIISVITGVGALNGYAQATEEDVTLYADGLSAVYNIKLEDLLKTLTAASEITANNLPEIGGAPDISFQISPSDITEIDITEAINAIYVHMTEYAGLAETIDTVTIDTITKTALTAQHASFVLDADTLNALFAGIAATLDESGYYGKFVKSIITQYVPMAGLTPTTEDITDEDILAKLGIPNSATEIYTQYIEPLKLNVSGDIYLSDAVAFMDVSINSDTIGILPIALEVSVGDAPALIGMIDMSEAGENMQVVLAVNGGESTYAELSVIADEIKIMSLQYSCAFNAEYGADLYQVYAGVMAGEGVIEMSGQYITDDATYRLMYAGINANDMQLELNYNGAISKTDKYTETAQITLSSNAGLSGKLNVALGEADAQLIEIPADENLPVIDIATITDEQMISMQTDMQTFAGMLTMYMLYGVPGFAALMQ